MKNLSKFYINGEWVTPDSEQMFPVLNPATEARIGTVVLGNAADVDRAVAAAKAAFESYSQASKTDRLGLLERLLEATRARIEDLAQAMRMEMGAPITMARGRASRCRNRTFTGVYRCAEAVTGAGNAGQWRCAVA